MLVKALLYSAKSSDIRKDTLDLSVKRTVRLFLNPPIKLVFKALKLLAKLHGELVRQIKGSLLTLCRFYNIIGAKLSQGS